MAALRNSWPSDDDDRQEPEPEPEPQGQHHGPQHALGSGPLCCEPPEQITASFEARLVRRFTSPELAGGETIRAAECSAPQRGDTDEVECLSEAEARILRRYMAAPTPAWMARPAHATLPPLLPDLSDPTRPLAAPFTVAGGRALATATAHAPVETPVPSVQANAYPPPYQPVNITRLVLAQFTISLQDNLLPPNVLALLDTRERRIVLAPALAPQIASRGTWGNYRERLERAIEARPISRIILAALYARWHSRMPEGVPDAPCYVAAFAPTSGLSQHEWRAWHGPLYTRLYAQTCRLVNPIEGKLGAVYLGIRGGAAYNRYGLPRLGADLRSAVTRRALTIVPALRDECHTPQEFSERAWVHFCLWVSRQVGVPLCVVRDRLDGDRRAIRTPDDLCRWTDELLADAPEVAEWRAQTARAFGLNSETRRDGRYMTAAQRVALWLAEPSTALR